MLSSRGRLVVLVALGAASWMPRSLAQPGVAPRDLPKIWRGVYTDEQAARGKAEFQTTCTTCHNFDLTGNSGRGPALVGEPFLANWETESVGALFTRLKTTMPRNNPGSLSDDLYTDLLAFILQANAYPSGAEALDGTRLGDIQFLKKDGSGRKVVPAFAMVAMVGCLTQADSRWVLTHTTQPVATEERPANEAELKDAGARPLGDETFRLVSAAGSQPDAHRGQKVEAKGLLDRATADKRLNVTSLQTLGSSCP